MLTKYDRGNGLLALNVYVMWGLLGYGMWIECVGKL